MSTSRTSHKPARNRPYLHRVLDDELDEKVVEFAAISVEGPKAVGKTETAQRRAKTDYRLDGPASQVVAGNPQVVAVITTGPYAYRRPDGIAVVPAALLGP